MDSVLDIDRDDLPTASEAEAQIEGIHAELEDFFDRVDRAGEAALDELTEIDDQKTEAERQYEEKLEQLRHEKETIEHNLEKRRKRAEKAREKANRMSAIKALSKGELGLLKFVWYYATASS